MMKDCTNGGCECTPNQSIKCTDCESFKLK